MEHDVTGEVVAREWQHEFRRETFQKVTVLGWRDELEPQPARMPVDGSGEIAGVDAVRDCEQRQRGSRQVQDGYERDCELRTLSKDCGTRTECSRKKMGNGFAMETCVEVPKSCTQTRMSCRQVPRYRNEPLYAEQCTYDTWAWKQVEQLEARGKDDMPRWPEGAQKVGPLDRGLRMAAYTARIHYRLGGKLREYKYQLRNEASYHAIRKGQPVTLRVQNNGVVRQVWLPDAAP